MDAVDIVPIAEGHIAGFHRTLDVVARERRYLAFLEAPAIETTRAFILDMIERGYPQFVALSEAEVVGWCDVTPKSRPVFEHSGVLGMGLLPPFRGRGIGTRLMQRALDAARAFGLSRVELTVRQDNANAIALYRKFGFQPEGLQRQAMRVDGEDYNLLLMAVLF
jgi:ribosomal protein S18 acetylase RimI-like enzyme